MRTEFLCVSVLRVASGPRVKLVSCKSALNPPVVYSTDRSKAVVPVLVLLFVALWFILGGDLLYVLPCDILFLCFSVLLVLRLPRLGKRELILVLFVRLFDLHLFGFVGFLFLLVSGKGCGLWLWHSLDFSLTFSWCISPSFDAAGGQCFVIVAFSGYLYIYSWLPLSRPRLSRITTYLEVKLWSLPKYENLTTGKKIFWKRGEIVLKSISPLFQNIFNVPLTSRVQLNIYVLTEVVRIILSSILQIW